ncbi:MAG: flippase-like domain-containing protein [Firmicutes bacterium]|nr:flippase-like domain-containing protein [Bacillota bacterium]
MLKRWFWWLAAGVLLLFLWRQVDMAELQHSVAQIPWQVLVALLVVQIVTQVLLNFQWYRIAKLAAIDIPFWRMFYINAQGSVMESITPGVKVGGEITRAVQIARIGNCSGHQAAVVVALQKIFSLSAFVLINIFSVLYLSNRSALFPTSPAKIAILGVLVVFVLIFCLMFLLPKRMLNWLAAKEEVRPNRSGAVRRFLQNLLEHILLFENQSGELILQFVLALAIWLLYPAKLYVLAVQIQPDIPLVYIGSITFVSYLIGMLPLFPGGLGGFEGTMTGLLRGLGVPLSGAAALAVIFRFVTFWFVILVSLCYAAVYNMINRHNLNLKEC